MAKKPTKKEQEVINDIKEHLEQTKEQVVKEILDPLGNKETELLNKKYAIAHIAQVCLTIQGEGPKLGTPCILVRFAGCNLQCPFCDTKWANKELPDMLTFKNILETEFPIKLSTSDNSIEKFAKYLKDTYFDHYPIKHIMFTGGEPFISDNLRILTEIMSFLNNKFHTGIKSIEIETNGTLVTASDIYNRFVSANYDVQLNISPKLDLTAHNKQYSSFQSLVDKFKIVHLYVSDRNNVLTNFNYNYKFIYDKAGEDLLRYFITQVGIPSDKICIMPLTPHLSNMPKDEFYKKFKKSCEDTILFCVKNNYKFTDRAHVWIYDMKETKNELDDVLRRQ
jgi:organic radical activating enzyme